MTRPKRPEERANRLGHDPATGRFTPDHPYPAGPAAGIGLPTTLNDETTAAFARVLPEGGIRPACRRLGVDRATFQRWRRRGEQERAAGIFETVFARFSFAVDKALGEEEARIYRGIMDGSIDVRAGTFVLERRFDYQAKTSIEINEGADPGHARQRIQDLFATTVGVIDVSPASERRDAEGDEPRGPLALPGGTEPRGQ